MINSFDRHNVKMLSDEIQNILQEFAQQWGVSVTRGNCKFSPQNFELKINVALITEGKVETREAVNFRTMASLYSLQASDMGRTFHKDGRKFEIVGLKPQSRKYPVLAKDITPDSAGEGRVYKFSSETVRVGLERAAKIAEMLAKITEMFPPIDVPKGKMA